jgi:hypothetical protein
LFAWTVVYGHLAVGCGRVTPNFFLSLLSDISTNRLKAHAVHGCSLATAVHGNHLLVHVVGRSIATWPDDTSLLLSSLSSSLLALVLLLLVQLPSMTTCHEEMKGTRRRRSSRLSMTGVSATIVVEREEEGHLQRSMKT